MHELALAEGVVQLIEQHAEIGGFTKVKAVWLEVGQLSGVEPEALSFCFDAVARGTLAEGSRLEIVAVEGQGWCAGCNRQVNITERYSACPNCGGYAVQVTGGTEMRVKELEVE